MGRSENILFKLPDDKIEELGELYRRLCARQRNDVLMRGLQCVTFEQFVADRVHAENLAHAVLLRRLKQKRLRMNVEET